MSFIRIAIFITIIKWIFIYIILMLSEIIEIWIIFISCYIKCIFLIIFSLHKCKFISINWFFWILEIYKCVECSMSLVVFTKFRCDCFDIWFICSSWCCLLDKLIKCVWWYNKITYKLSNGWWNNICCMNSYKECSIMSTFVYHEFHKLFCISFYRSIFIFKFCFLKHIC